MNRRENVQAYADLEELGDTKNDDLPALEDQESDAGDEMKNQEEVETVMDEDDGTPEESGFIGKKRKIRKKKAAKTIRKEAEMKEFDKMLEQEKKNETMVVQEKEEAKLTVEAKAEEIVKAQQRLEKERKDAYFEHCKTHMPPWPEGCEECAFGKAHKTAAKRQDPEMRDLAAVPDQRIQADTGADPSEGCEGSSLRSCYEG